MATISRSLAIALAHHQAGRLQAAEQIYRQILAVEPSQPDAWHLLGIIAAQADQHEVAVQYIQRAIALNGNVAAFHSNLGNAFRDLGKLDEAIACQRRALELNPHHAAAHNNLGSVLGRQGQRHEAVACFRRALELKPDYAAAHNNLGTALRDQGKPDEAIACYRRAVALQPDFAEAYYNLGCALKLQEKLDEAVDCYRRALELQPDYAAAHNNLGIVLQDQGKLDEAAACYRRALQLKPDAAVAHANLGNVLQDQGKLDEAAACYRRVVQLEMGCAPGGRADRRQSGASREPAPGTEARDNLAKVFFHLTTILGDRLPEEDLAAMRRLSRETDLCDDDRTALQFGLAQACDARGDYGAAAKYLGEANAARGAAWKRQGRQYDPAQYGAFVTKLLATFTPQFFARTDGFGLPAKEPVFIVGLPRSGTTLVEHILASNPGVFGAGELRYCEETFQSLPQVLNRNDTPFECLADLDRETTRRLARRHFDRLRALDPQAVRIVDKMPENYQYLGLIRVLFPQARLIHCRRDLRDVALSCWRTNFAFLPWACDPDHIVSHFEAYLRLTAHWQNVLPAPPLDVDYEELVDDTEGVVRRIVGWCGLEWDPRCLRFYETQRAVRTAGGAQVRRPIYHRSVGHWKHYEQPLGDLLSRVQQLAETWRPSGLFT